MARYTKTICDYICFLKVCFFMTLVIFIYINVFSWQNGAGRDGVHKTNTFVESQADGERAELELLDMKRNTQENIINIKQRLNDAIQNLERINIQARAREDESNVALDEQSLLGFDLEYFLFLVDKIFPKSGDPKHAEFNETLSHSIPLDRMGTDYRHGDCSTKNWTFNTNMKVSIVVIFKDEPWSTLLRTVVSILIKSPLQHIRDVIFVDDQSTREYLLQPLERLITSLHHFKLVRTPFKMGVARSRNFGARQAKGTMVVFFDSHCEVSVGWLEPLMEAISDDPTRIAVCTTDHITPTELNVRKGYDNLQIIFDWKLGADFSYFRAGLLNKYKITDAIPSVSLMGQVVAVDKAYFFSIGSFADYFDGWGGEDVDISIKSWLCGGGVVKCRCSRIIHLAKSHPYVMVNDPRINVYLMAETWLDELLPIHKCTTVSLTSADTSVLKPIKALKRKLKCKSFKWLIENIYTELEIPEANTTHIDPVTTHNKYLRVDADHKTLRFADIITPTLCSIALVNSRIKCKGSCLTVNGTSATFEPCNTSSDSNQLWKYEGGKLRPFLQGDSCLTIGEHGIAVVRLCGDQDHDIKFKTQFKTNCLK